MRMKFLSAINSIGLALALLTTSWLSAEAAYKGGSGKIENSEESKKNDNEKNEKKKASENEGFACKNRGKGCRHHRERYEKARSSVGEYRRDLGSKARSWGNQGSSSCRSGQGSCASSTGRGYRGFASTFGATASALTSSAADLKKAQREIVQESTGETPGAGNPEAIQFEKSTQDGKSRYADFEATDPVVKEQVEDYNALGGAIDELEKESDNYKQQQNEMSALAEKSEKNAVNLEAQNQYVAENHSTPLHNSPGESTRESTSEKFGSAATSSRKVDSDISEKAGKSSEGTKYPEKKLESLTLVNGKASRKNSLRNLLREHLEVEVAGPEQENLAERGENSRGKNPGRNDPKEDMKRVATLDAANAEDSISVFGKKLGGAPISMAGSETDASVKALLRDFSDSGSARSPASRQSSEIGQQDGPSLFERCHETHKRCEKNGCVTLASGRKGAGG